MITITRQLILQVKEMMERTHSNVFEIASRLNLDPDDVRRVMDIINQILT